MTCHKLKMLLSMPVLLALACTVSAQPEHMDGSDGYYSCKTVFQDVVVSGHHGWICTWKDGRRIAETAIPSSIKSISASEELCIAATYQGLLYFSKDARTWKMTDFNAEYSEYYGQVRIQCVCASKAGLMIAGLDENDLPVVFESAEGKVWSPRELSYTGSNGTEILNETPLSLEYDAQYECYVMDCTNGYIFIMPGCSHCNELINTNK